MISMKKGTQKIARYGALFRIMFSPPNNHNLSLSLPLTCAASISRLACELDVLGKETCIETT